MIESTLYYAVIATLTSFAWLILTGYRPRGESRFVGVLHLGFVLVASALIFLVWQRDLGLTVVFSFGYAALCALLWKRKPDWNSRGSAFLVAFGIAQMVFLGRILWAILFSDLAPPVMVVSTLINSILKFESTVVSCSCIYTHNVSCRTREGSLKIFAILLPMIFGVLIGPNR